MDALFRELVEKPSTTEEGLAQQSKATFEHSVAPLQLKSFSDNRVLFAHSVEHSDMLYVPTSKRFAALDALCPSGAYGIQVTVSPTHDLKVEGLRVLFQSIQTDQQASLPTDVGSKSCVQHAP